MATMTRMKQAPKAPTAKPTPATLASHPLFVGATAHEKAPATAPKAKPSVSVAKAAPVAPAPKAPERKAAKPAPTIKAPPAPVCPTVAGNAMVAQWEAGKLPGQELQSALRSLGLHLVQGKAVRLPAAKNDLPRAELSGRVEGGASKSGAPKKPSTHGKAPEAVKAAHDDNKAALKASGVDAKDKAAVKARTFETLLAGIDAGTVTASDKRWDDVSADQLDAYFRAHKASGEYKGYSGLRKSEKVAYLCTGDRPDVKKAAPGPNTMAANLEWLRAAGGTAKGYSVAITALCKQHFGETMTVSKLKAEQLRSFVAIVKAHDTAAKAAA